MGMHLTRRVIHAWLLFGAVLVGACGGGGGGSNDPGGAGGGGSPPPPAATAPVIDVAPASVSVTVGQTANFSVTAGGSAPLAYQWQRDGTPIAGATGAGYSIGAVAIGDNAARFSVVVSNAAGSVTSSDAVLTVTTAASPPSGPSSRYVPVWSSTDTTAETGSYTLSVVDPDAPGTLIAVDQVTTTNNNLESILRVRGGIVDAGSGHVLDPGVRHLVYVKDGSLYRVSLDKGGATPSPVRLSNEFQAGGLQPIGVAAVSDSGDDALISYFLPRNAGIRYVGLSATSTTAPRANPVFPGDVLGAAGLAGWSTDPTTGAIAALYWHGLRPGGGSRLFRTDASFGNPLSVATFASGIGTLLGVGGNGARMRNGLFFMADGALRRLDFNSGNLRVVRGAVSNAISAGVFDDTHAYLLVQGASERQLVRAADDDSSPGQVIASGAALAGYTGITTQTRDHLLFFTGAVGETAVSVRKTDGVFTPLPPPSPPSGLTHSWVTPFTFSQGTVGDRAFYQFPGVVGSVNADGTDRREHSGYFLPTLMGLAAIPPHRLHASQFHLPAARILVQRGSALTWLELATGDLGATVGNSPGIATFGNEPGPYHDYMLGRVGAIGYQSRVQVTPGTFVGRLDALLLTDQAGSLLRLTNHIP